MSTKYTIRFTTHARDDMFRIFSYISNNLYAPQAAKRIMKKIDDSINNLSDYPFSSPLIDDEFLARKGLRRLVVEDYVVIYKIQEKAFDVIIYRVFNGRTNYINMLNQ